MGTKKLDFKGNLRVKTRTREELNTEGMNPKELKQFLKDIRYRKIEILARHRSLEIAKFMGKYSKYIKAALKEELERLEGTTMMIHAERAKFPGVASTRGSHARNVAEIAYKIALGIFRDEEIAEGIALAAFLHDIGQPPMGHNGETYASNASNEKQGGPQLHNITGATQIIERLPEKIGAAIEMGIKAEILKEEANRRGITEEKMVNILQHEEENELRETIRKKVVAAMSLKKRTVEILAMAAGEHNGERGKPTIEPNYRIDFKKFYQILRDCYVDKAADKKMEASNMISAIVKIADQISSIPYDMIDGLRGGVVTEIPETFVSSVAGMLEITEEQARERIKTASSEFKESGSDKQLEELVGDIQDRIIESVIAHSNYKIINMDPQMAIFLYVMMRKKVSEEYLRYTTSPDEERILKGVWMMACDMLSTDILGEGGVFPPELNKVFEMKLDDPNRETQIENARQERAQQKHKEKEYDGEDKLQGFYDYILETSIREYETIKLDLRQK